MGTATTPFFGSTRLFCFVALLVVYGGLGMILGHVADIGAHRIESVSPQRVAVARDKTPDGLSASDWSGIRDAYERHRHEVVAVANEDGVWRARNPRQHWLMRFDRDGLLVEPVDGGWTWGLALAMYGRGESLQAVDATARASVKGQRVTYLRRAELDEWFINDRRGLEHGFTLHARPSGEAGPVVFDLTVRGPLKPHIASDGRGVTFEADGVSVVNYTGLTVFDADGRVLSARFERRSDEAIRLLIDDHGKRYPITIDPIAQQAYLKASNTGAGDRFGEIVAISGDTVVVGAPMERSNATGVDGDQTDDSVMLNGAAYVFIRNGGAWHQQAYLKASNTGTNFFGASVAVSGDTVVIGAHGDASSATGVDGDPTDNSAPSSGAAYVFGRSGNVWRQQSYLKASNTGLGDQFGYRVGVSGDTVVVGAIGEDSNAPGVDGNQADDSLFGAGAAYVFVRSGTLWNQQAYLKASNPGFNDAFGFSVAVFADTLVVGAVVEDSDATGVNGDQTNNNAIQSGAAYVFVRSGAVWSQQAYLKASNTGSFDEFGRSVAVFEDTVVIGAEGEASNAAGVNGDQTDNSALNSGAAYVFTRTGNVWRQQAYLKASNPETGDFFGWSVAVDADIVVVGAPIEDSNATGVDGDQTNNNAQVSGAAYVFMRNGSAWTQQSYLKASNADAGDAFGISVALSADTVVIGAANEASNATGVGGDPTNNSIPVAGAVYVFTITGPDLNPPVHYEIVSRNSDRCLDVSYASMEAAASVIQWICHGGKNQQWRLEPVSGGAFRIVARHSGQVLDVYGGLVDDVTPIIQYPWHGGDNQLWAIEPASNGYVFIVARHSGKVLDVKRASVDDGARVIQYTLHGGANQQWLLRAVAPTADSISTLSDREP